MLYSKKSKHINKLDYKENINVFKNRVKTIYDKTVNSRFDIDNKNINNSIKILKSVPWRQGYYDRQHWGNWLHSVSPYVGRITPAFAHWLIKIFSRKKDLILDPFCGIGTIPLEADLLGRRAIGIDLNPYACIISKAKFDRVPMSKLLDYINKLKLNTKNIDLRKVDPFIRQYFYNNTLKEIIALKKNLFKDIKKKKKGSYFLLGCLMGILHGNRPGYLSTWTGCIIPYPPHDKNNPKFDPSKDVPEYRVVIPRMIAKIKRMYIDGFETKTDGQIFLADSREMPLKSNSVNLIISSPPYYNTLDYSSANRLRLAILDLNNRKRDKLADDLIQQKNTYLIEMLKIGREVKRVLKPDSLCVWILGDMHESRKSYNTAKDVGKLYKEELGFEILTTVVDEIPRSKATHQKSKKSKLDRIIVLKNKK